MASRQHQVFPCFPEFARLLRLRVVQSSLLTEDSIRFTFFAALLKIGIEPHEIVLEYPHEAIERAKIDTVLLWDDGVPHVAVEFKYDREIPSGRNQARTKRAGAVFNDMTRLCRLPPSWLRYFVHLTDQEMEGYWRNENNRLAKLFTLRSDEFLSISAEQVLEMPQTFRTELKNWSGGLTAKCVYREDLPNSNYLRIYEVS